MAVSRKVLATIHSADRDEVVTFEVLLIFSGAGLTLSLFLAMVGWI